MEKPPIKDKAVQAYVNYIEDKLNKFTSSPYCDQYITLKRIVDSSNNKIRNLDIDFASDEADKLLSAVEKWVTKQKLYSEQLEYFYNKMTPPERKDVEQKMKEEAGLAERIALSEKEGK